MPAHGLRFQGHLTRNLALVEQLRTAAMRGAGVPLSVVDVDVVDR